MNRAKTRLMHRANIQKALAAEALRQTIGLDCCIAETGDVYLSAALSMACGYLSPGLQVDRECQIAVRKLVRLRLDKAGRPAVFATDYAGDLWQVEV